MTSTPSAGPTTRQQALRAHGSTQSTPSKPAASPTTTDTTRVVDVSVIVPLYNGARFIEGAIASVAEQTHLPRELIVIDDGSSDDGAMLATDLSAPFPITIVRQDNAGQSAARNHGASIAAQPFLAFLDQDDVWLPNHLAVLHQAAAVRDDIGWVYGDFDEIDQHGQLVTKRFLREHHVRNPKSTLIACISGDLMVLPSASLIRRDAYLALGGFDEELSGYEDDDLFIRFFRAGWDHVYVDRPVTRFRVHPGSSSQHARFLASRVKFGRKLMDTIQDDHQLRRYYYRDVVVPRFFQQCLDEYVRHVTAKDWERAEHARDAMNAFATGRGDIGKKHWKLRLIQQPRRLRRVLQVQAHLPRRLHISTNPAMHLH